MRGIYGVIKEKMAVSDTILLTITHPIFYHFYYFRIVNYMILQGIHTLLLNF